MKLKLDLDPDLVEMLRGEILAGERAVTAAMREAGGDLKNDWRAQISGAGLGLRLARTIRNKTYPERDESLDAAAFIWSRAPKIIHSHDRGVLIRSKHGFYLAIPTEVAGKGRGGARLTPLEWERRRGLKLRFIYRRGGPSLLVAEKARINARGTAVASRAKTGRGQVSAPIFLLVPQVKLRKRLDLARDAERVAGRVPELIVSSWIERR
ncbi:hypothetical protein A9Q96_04710 [Rhodobacterales bacterium 52_120_T64]|nr:hypothetical protein A9Q96_04710 [Rhodobacterales bacterium 52_120_T64]